jgi:hypothetical protein
MKRPTFFEGVGFALVASIGGSVAYAALSALAGGGQLRPVVTGVALGYVLYLLARAPGRAGRVTAVAAWCVAALGLWLAAPPLALFLLAHLGLIWLVRSLFYRSGVLPALADLALGVAALAAGVWAVVHSGSVLLGLWCFFLVQAAFVAIPDGPWRLSRQDVAPQDDGFERAHRAAEAAVRRLSSIH